MYHHRLSLIHRILFGALAFMFLAGCGTAPTSVPSAPEPASPPAPSETVTPYETALDSKERLTLRPGRVADVSDAGTFVDTYRALYEENSNISAIRLMGSFALYSKSLRSEGGADPWLSEYPQQLVLRMPEGTALDLNGNNISIRACQGYDDNGTGTPSGLKTLGTVIDSFGGGSINLYSFYTGKDVQYAIDLAEAYPGIVNMISLSEEITGAEDMEFTVPANVCLKFSGKQSALKCKSLTFRQGATMTVASPDTAPGIAGTEKVVFEYVTEEDLKRAGADLATEKVQVAESILPEVKRLYLAETPPEEKTGTPITFIETSADATDDVALIRNPAFTSPTPPAEYTRELKQKALIETALAYYYHNPHVQYDGRGCLVDNKLARHSDNGTPEQAAYDSPVYSVCSNYCYKIYFQTFGYKILGKNSAATKTWATVNPDNPITAFLYNGPIGGPEMKKAMEESRKILQPGDIINSYGTSGHAMFFIGDAFGDGTEYCLHCWGKSHDLTTGQDYIEAGSIKLQPVDELVYQKGASPNWYVDTEAHSKVGFTVLRPLDDPNFPLTPTDDAVCRLRYPGLTVTRELDRTKFIDAATGDEIPVFVTITNNGDTTYDELIAEEYLPQGAVYVDGSATGGIAPDGTTLRWALKVPAGKTVTLTYRVRLTAARGEKILFASGNVGGLKSRETSLVVGGTTLTENERYAIHSCAEALNGTKSEAYEDLAVFNRFYEEALGVKIGLPATVQELLDKVSFVNASSSGAHRFRFLRDDVAAEDLPLLQMILPLHFTGRYVENDGSPWSRVRDYRTGNYLPGDLFIGLCEPNTVDVTDRKGVDFFVYIGNGHVLKYASNGKLSLETFDSTMGFAMKYNVFMALRPTLGYDKLPDVAN